MTQRRVKNHLGPVYSRFFLIVATWIPEFPMDFFTWPIRHEEFCKVLHIHYLQELKKQLDLYFHGRRLQSFSQSDVRIPHGYHVFFYEYSTFVCLSQARTSFFNIVCHGFFFFVISELRWEAIVRFVDIGGIYDHHCLNFLFIKWGFFSAKD